MCCAITAQLVNVESGYHLWADRYEREMDDVFAIQDDIAQQIAETLKIQIVGEKRVSLRRRHTEDREAFHIYLKGRYHWNRRP